jgi:ribosomal protein S24E
MKLNKLSERENPHMKRKEVQIEIEHEAEATPKRDALHALISKQFGFESDKTDIRGIFSSSGAPKSLAKVFVWQEKQPEQKKKEKKEKAKK